MSSNGGGADAGSGAGGAARQSKRAKKQTGEQKHLKAVRDVYYPSYPQFPPLVDHRDDWVPPPILVFFNAKGGTLKTSHTWTTAHIMSSELRGLKVLAVDMDSQRDLSRSMLKAKLLRQAAASGGPPIGMHEHLARPFTPEEVETYANLDLPVEHDYFGANGLTRTLEGALQPMMGDSPVVKRVVPEEVTDNLFLLPGSPVMEDIDRRMTISEGLLQDATQRNWQGAPLHVIMETARVIEADIVLLDLNPSLSTINRNMIMSSDYIVVTTRPEEYSLENMDTFVNKMVRNDPIADTHGGSWLQQMMHNIRPEVNFTHVPGKPSRYPLPTTVPKVLGCVIADYRSKANVENTMNPTRPPDFLSTQVNGVFHDGAAGALQIGINSITTRMRQIMNTISSIEVTAPPGPHRPPAISARMTIGSEVYAAAGLTCLLAKIRSYESLGPLTHHSGVPAPFIKNEHCVNVETGRPLDGGDKQPKLKRAADFKRRYDQLAWNILKLMNNDTGGKLQGRLDWALQDRRGLAGGPTRPNDGYPGAPQGVIPGY